MKSNEVENTVLGEFDCFTGGAEGTISAEWGRAGARWVGVNHTESAEASD